MVHAGPDGFCGTGSQLIRQLGIREELSSHRDEISLPLSDRAFSLIRTKTADGDDRNIDVLLDLRSEAKEAAREVCRVRFGKSDPSVGIGIEADMQCIGSRRLSQNAYFFFL